MHPSKKLVSLTIWSDRESVCNAGLCATDPLRARLGGFQRNIPSARCEVLSQVIAFPVSVLANFPDTMADDIFDLAVGARCKLSPLGYARSPRATTRAGTVVGRGRSTSSVRVLFDGHSRPVSLHKKYVELISAESEAVAPQRPRDVADRLLELRDLHRVSDDESLRETFTLPLHAARLKARQILNEHPQTRRW